MENPSNNLKQNAELTAQFANLINYLRTDWPELMYSVANGAAFLLDVCQTVNQNHDSVKRVDDTGFFMVSDMLQSIMALIDHVKPFADYAQQTTSQPINMEEDED